jgi:hypothetical protein
MQKDDIETLKSTLASPTDKGMIEVRFRPFDGSPVTATCAM